MWLRGLRNTVVTTLLLVLVVVVHSPSALGSPLELASRRNRQGGYEFHDVEEGKRGAVASESAICSHQGTKMLGLGGNAADAVSRAMCSLSRLSRAECYSIDGCDRFLCWCHW